MQMGVAEKGTRGVIATRVGRIERLPRQLFCGLLVELARVQRGVLYSGLLGCPDRNQNSADHESGCDHFEYPFGSHDLPSRANSESSGALDDFASGPRIASSALESPALAAAIKSFTASSALA